MHAAVESTCGVEQTDEDQQTPRGQVGEHGRGYRHDADSESDLIMLVRGVLVP